MQTEVSGCQVLVFHQIKHRRQELRLRALESSITIDRLVDIGRIESSGKLQLPLQMPLMR